MTWLAWRQQRIETLVALGILGLLLVLFVPTGIRLSDHFGNDGISACLSSSAGSDCAERVTAFQQRFKTLQDMTSWFGILPILVGILFAAPFILELERGTYRLAWTQSISRERWIGVKLLVLNGSVLVFALAMTLLLTWWRRPLDRIEGRIDPGTFQIEGLAPIAYCLFATALMISLGAILRRTIAAIGIGAVVFLVARIGIETWVRPHYRPAVEASSAQETPVLRTAWILDRMGNGPAAASYQPDSRFWTFQSIEAIIFLSISLLLIATAFYSIRRWAR